MKFKLLFLAFIYLSNIQAQNYNYDIFLLHNHIGGGVASQIKNNDGSVNYILKTKANAKVLFKNRTAFLDVKLLFKNNVLVSGVFSRETNGEYQKVKFINKDGKTYYLENGEEQLIDKPIKFTTTQFFFQEPVGIEEVYIERLNKFFPIEKNGNSYKTDVEGNVNYYIYQNGELIEYQMKNIIDICMIKT